MDTQSVAVLCVEIKCLECLVSIVVFLGSLLCKLLEASCFANYFALGAVYILRSQKIEIFDPLPPPVCILFTLVIPPLGNYVRKPLPTPNFASRIFSTRSESKTYNSI